MQFYPRAQAGLEYLMTYGWALVLIITVASVLFFVFSPSSGEKVNFSLSNNKQILFKAGNVKPGGGANSGELLAQNASGGTITVTDATPSGSFSGTPTVNSSLVGGGQTVKVNGGQEMKISGLTVNCATGTISGSIAITYTDKDNYTKTATIQATGKCTSGGGPTIACYNNGDCTDGNPCTTDTCNNPGQPTSNCTHSAITQCTSGDGCCPTGCTYPTDTDCTPTGYPNGHACSVGGDCASSFCVGNICCNNACSGECQTNTCATGTCVNKPDNTRCDLMQSCQWCQNGSCVGATTDNAGAIALGCMYVCGSSGCLKCNNGGCGCYADGQQGGCPVGLFCGYMGYCNCPGTAEGYYSGGNCWYDSYPTYSSANCDTVCSGAGLTCVPNKTDTSCAATQHFFTPSPFTCNSSIAVSWGPGFDSMGFYCVSKGDASLCSAIPPAGFYRVCVCQ